MQTILIIFGVALAAALAVVFFISRRSQKVMESLLLLLTKPERAKIMDASRVLQTILADEIQKIDDGFKTMQETLAAQLETAAAMKKDLSIQNINLVTLADDATKKIATMSQRLENTVMTLQNIVGSTGWREVDESTDKFTSRVNDLLNRIDTTSQETLEQTTKVQNQIDSWIESGKTLSEQLRSDVEDNVSQIKSMADESGNMRQQLSALAQSTADGFDNVKTAATDYEKLMEHNDKLLGSQIQKMDTFTKQSKTLLNNQMNTLTNTANVVGGQVRLAESSIEKQVRKLVEAVEALMSSAMTTEGSVRNVSNELAGLTNRFNGEIKEFATGVVGELKTVSGVANVTLENTRTAAGAFSESVRAMATGVRETLMEMNTAHTQLSGQSANLIKMSAKTTAQLQPLSELIEKYYAALPDLSKGSVDMAENMEKIVAAMNEKIHLLKQTVTESMSSMSESSVKLESLSGQSRQQMIDLMSDYAKAVNTMQTLNKQMMVARATAPMEAIKATPSASYGRISSADFIRQSEKLMEKIHEQSLDLTRSTGAEIPDAVWQKYHAGDKTIFTKWLARMLGAADKKRVRELLKSDTVFRSQATQFTRSFGKILNAAEQSDNSEMLVGTLLKTDLGQVYVALKSHI
ncbi:MAG: methyl-accepting chemotaxis protein [Rickettsiales bacterium]|jgi:hypothetical protein|nr:methyl-accepting chemotaxis protein [Rickettsiales bacterium]